MPVVLVAEVGGGVLIVEAWRILGFLKETCRLEIGARRADVEEES